MLSRAMAMVLVRAMAIGSECTHPCRLRDAIGTYTLAVLNPLYDLTKDYPQTVDDLPRYCPCSLTLAWKNVHWTFKHLPQPLSVHPFYRNRKESSLFQRQDLLSWLIWLWGNKHVPWRRVDIGDFSLEELEELYIQGHWNNSMPGTRFLNMNSVLKKRSAKSAKLPPNRLF